MTEPICIITGHVVGHPDTCDDCDPCISGKASPPVQRLIREIEEWRERYSDAMSRNDELRLTVMRLKHRLSELQ